jgi:hypothetical protein
MDPLTLLESLYKATNPLLMFAVGGLAVLCHRSQFITEKQAWLGPIAIGVMWGPVVVIGHARDLGGWIKPEVLVMLMFESAFINGFAAGLAGRLCSIGWDWFINKVTAMLFGSPSVPQPALPDRNPLTPPAPLHSTRGNAVRNNGDDTMTTEIRNEEERR